MCVYKHIKIYMQTHRHTRIYIHTYINLIFVYKYDDGKIKCLLVYEFDINLIIFLNYVI